MLLCSYSVWYPTRWERIYGEVLVESKEQWERWIEKKHPREFRDNPYGSGGDSLEVQFERITLPLEM